MLESGRTDFRALGGLDLGEGGGSRKKRADIGASWRQYP